MTKRAPPWQHDYPTIRTKENTENFAVLSYHYAIIYIVYARS